MAYSVFYRAADLDVYKRQSQEDPDLKPFAELLLSLPLSGRIVGILHTWNDSLSDAVKNDCLLYTSTDGRPRGTRRPSEMTKPVESGLQFRG